MDNIIQKDVFSKEAFLAGNVKGEFAFWANLTGSVLEDGKVYYDEEGLLQFTFDTVADFVAHYFDSEPANYDVCSFVGERSDEGVITFFEGHSMELDGVDDEDDDGGAVYSAPVRYSSKLEIYIAMLELAESPDSVAPYIFKSHRVYQTANLATCRDKLFLIDELDMKPQMQAFDLDTKTCELGEEFYIEIHTPVTTRL